MPAPAPAPAPAGPLLLTAAPATPVWDPSTHYSLFGVAEDAPIEVINSAYRRAAVHWHPDKAAAEDKELHTERLQVLASAIGELRDEEWRAVYDCRLALGREGKERERQVAAKEAEAVRKREEKERPKSEEEQAAELLRLAVACENTVALGFMTALRARALHTHPPHGST